ncbi:MAG: hypothetical protein ACD_78C00006G0006 [uncultured bacterium (gcode 4)]|uniref:4Fe-4S ferredoxin-type domain-containing protein n=1 Tax=uncultured bacterium (gcode 4) TaxID=1234023 RepID=K1XZL4_9BACT|nr:MAG: hypothetical protein ACD_78C00006G0006 [uncultured bacterium (gcode 4)]
MKFHTIRKQKFYSLLSEPMPQIDKAKIAGIAAALKRKPVVSSACIGCGACVAISGEVFELNDDGYSIVIDLSDYEGKDVDDSISACPVNAISWTK